MTHVLHRVVNARCIVQYVSGMMYHVFVLCVVCIVYCVLCIV